MSGRRPLGYNPDTGMMSYWHDDGEGGWAEEQQQHTETLLDLNKAASNHCNPYNAGRDVRMRARIPLIIIAKWQNELGVDYWNPDHQAKVDRLLDDPEWAYLRTDLGNPSVMFTPAGMKKFIL